MKQGLLHSVLIRTNSEVLARNEGSHFFERKLREDRRFPIKSRFSSNSLHGAQSAHPSPLDFGTGRDL